MKLQTLVVLFLAGLSGFTACKSENGISKDENGITHINLVNSHEIANSPNLAEIGKKVEYIPLEYNDECAVADVYKLFPANDFFLILTPDRFLQFGLDGRYMGEIGKKGNGPGEYVIIVDCIVDEESKLIYGLDMMNKRVLTYNFNGSYVKNIPVSEFCFNFTQLQGGNFAVMPMNWNGNRESKMVVVDREGDTLKKFGNPVRFTRQNRPMLVEDQNAFKSYKDQVRFHQIFNDTIFSLNPQLELSPLYIMDCGNYKIPLEIIGDYEKWGKKGKNYYLVENIQETDHQLFIKYKYNDQYHRLTYNKENGQLAHLGSKDSLGISNNLDNGLPFWPMTVRNTKEMMTLWPAFKLKEEVKRMQERGEKISQELKQLDQKLKITDNPVIQIVHEL